MRRIAMTRTYATMCATVAVLLLSGGLTLAQGLGGYPPGVNPSNPQDLTNRGNPQDLTLPGASNPQDLVRSPALPRAISPGPGPGTVGTSSLGLSLGHTYTVKAGKKFRRKRAPES
jgi:hypothetical protein